MGDTVPTPGFRLTYPYCTKSWGGGSATTISSHAYFFMNRMKIRQFINAVGWATPRNICYLVYGRFTTKDYRKINGLLHKMARTKRLPPLKKLPCYLMTVFASHLSKKKNIGSFKFLHDSRLRDCLARFFYDRNYAGIDQLRLDNNADSICGDMYFELDNGNEDRKQLAEKIRSHYSGKGKFQVIFWMTTDYYSHWKTKESIKKLEENRLNLLFEVVQKELRHKPNRVLAASYHQYLEDGKVYSYKEYSSK